MIWSNNQEIFLTFLYIIYTYVVQYTEVLCFDITLIFFYNHMSVNRQGIEFIQ